MGTRTGDIAKKPCKRMVELYSTEDAVKVATNLIGEEGGKGYEMVLSVFALGLHKKLLRFMNATKNEDLVLIAMVSQNQMYPLGSDILSAKFQGGDDSGI